ncbi:hypothetical protein AMTR_s00012p00255600 [Amborella trichopoda]|uniref:Uncharacterized protein n=1 Tax=Amborella trichopoda TaxID=13333 RepID=W1PDI8_AMBTC|nr:hypothetical protein AMTR_s00012p00255600 [Amborella trichopoda]
MVWVAWPVWTSPKRTTAYKICPVARPGPAIIRIWSGQGQRWPYPLPTLVKMGVSLGANPSMQKDGCDGFDPVFLKQTQP